MKLHSAIDAEHSTVSVALSLYTNHQSESQTLKLICGAGLRNTNVDCYKLLSLQLNCTLQPAFKW